jgi:hypothetical protein
MRPVPFSFAIAALAVALAATLTAASAGAGGGDAWVRYNQGLAARERGDEQTAYARFREACMDSEGLAEACLAWGALAEKRKDETDSRRALGSAVMLAPDSVRARFALVELLLKNRDWIWAAEHLEAALEHVDDARQEALLRYYLGYARFKNDEPEEASRQLSLALRKLPPELAQRAEYYKGLIAEGLEKPDKAGAMMAEASEGPEQRVSDAAESRLSSLSAFQRSDGFGGQAIASLGVNTHPAVAFLDAPGIETDPVLQSVFRGDMIVGAGGYSHGFQGMLTAYREQNWVELGGSDESSAFDPSDMNITLFVAQLAYVGRVRTSKLEHELRLGVDGELQLLDGVPEQNRQHEYEPTGFGPFTSAVAGKLWWSLASDPFAIWGARLKFEWRPNYIERDRSTLRTRLRLLHDRWFLDRALRLELLAGGRYDRSYLEPEVIKYDRLRPEASLDLRWNTPWSRLSLSAGGELRYNWYLNSRRNAANSFRPAYQPNPHFSEEENARFEKDYYDLARHDFEWEARAQARLRAWKRAHLTLRYTHHQRLCNLDDAPVPMINVTGEYERVAGIEYGYAQDLVVLELSQRF